MQSFLLKSLQADTIDRSCLCRLAVIPGVGSHRYNSKRLLTLGKEAGFASAGTGSLTGNRCEPRFTQNIKKLFARDCFP
jgi:hypothetical protein